MKFFRFTLILSVILFNSVGNSPADQKLSAWLGSSYVLPGEESELWLTVTSDSRPLEKPNSSHNEYIF